MVLYKRYNQKKWSAGKHWIDPAKHIYHLLFPFSGHVEKETYPVCPGQDIPEVRAKRNGNQN